MLASSRPGSNKGLDSGILPYGSSTLPAVLVGTERDRLLGGMAELYEDLGYEGGADGQDESGLMLVSAESVSRGALAGMLSAEEKSLVASIGEGSRKVASAISGGKLPAGIRIYPAIVVVHLREDLYPEAHEFRPERFFEGGAESYAWLPFGEASVVASVPRSLRQSGRR